MPITLVQSNSSGNNSGPSTVLAFGSNTAAGNLIVVSIGSYSNLPTFSDTGGNTFGNNTYSAAQSGKVWNLAIYYCLSARGGAESVTVTADTFALVTIAEYNTTGATGLFWSTDGAFVTGSGDSANLATSSPIVTTNPNDVIAAVAVSYLGGNAPGSGYTQIGTIGEGGTAFGLSEYQITTSTGTYPVTATCSPNNWTICGMAFKATVTNPVAASPSVSKIPVWRGAGVV